MTNLEKIKRALQSGGPQCDDCLSESSGVTPRQQVNQKCNRAAKTGEIHRAEKDAGNPCPICGGVKIVRSL